MMAFCQLAFLLVLFIGVLLDFQQGFPYPFFQLLTTILRQCFIDNLLNDLQCILIGGPPVEILNTFLIAVLYNGLQTHQLLFGPHPCMAMVPGLSFLLFHLQQPQLQLLFFLLYPRVRPQVLLFHHLHLRHFQSQLLDGLFIGFYFIILDCLLGIAELLFTLLNLHSQLVVHLLGLVQGLFDNVAASLEDFLLVYSLLQLLFVVKVLLVLLLPCGNLVQHEQQFLCVLVMLFVDLLQKVFILFHIRLLVIGIGATNIQNSPKFLQNILKNVLIFSQNLFPLIPTLNYGHFLHNSLDPFLLFVQVYRQDPTNILNYKLK